MPPSGNLVFFVEAEILCLTRVRWFFFFFFDEECGGLKIKIKCNLRKVGLLAFVFVHGGRSC